MHRIEPDPSEHDQNSWLAKFGWQITPSHRIAFTQWATQQKLGKSIFL